MTTHLDNPHVCIERDYRFVDSNFSSQMNPTIYRLDQKLQMRIKVVWTLPSDEPGPADHSSLHVGIVLRSRSE